MVQPYEDQRGNVKRFKTSIFFNTLNGSAGSLCILIHSKGAESLILISLLISGSSHCFVASLSDPFPRLLFKASLSSDFILNYIVEEEFVLRFPLFGDCHTQSLSYANVSLHKFVSHKCL